MKAKRSNKKISPYGGIVPILKKVKELGIPQAIRSVLGTRKKQSRYGYDDVFIAWVLTALCGGKRLDHITELKKHLNIFPGLKLPSHDTLGRVMKKLASKISAEKNMNYKKAKITINDYDNNIILNSMLIQVTKKAGALKEGKKYTLHIDATFIETNCAGANMSNEKERNGFHPMICLIDELPVYICMRNGGSNATFYLKESLEQCLDIMSQNKIIIDKVIIDGAGYDRKVTNLLHERGIKFNIHTPFNWTFKTMMRSIDSPENWEKVEVETGHNFRNCEIKEFPYAMTGEQNTFRLIVAKVPTRKGRELLEDIDEKQRRKYVEEKMKVLSNKNLLKRENKTYNLGKWKERKNYKYKLIITNDCSLTPLELLIEYNKRGNAERKFDFMKNDFGWKYPPFMKMNQNTVFMIAAAMANNIFRGVVATFKEKLPELDIKNRIGKFKRLFIDVVCYFVNGKYEFINQKFAYEKIC